jgi:hypothetical protein
VAGKVRLFEHDDFEQAMLRAAEHFDVSEQFIEKDYYVTEILRMIADRLGDRAMFKGGTSLSKGWDLISRFSERHCDVVLVSLCRGSHWPLRGQIKSPSNQDGSPCPPPVCLSYVRAAIRVRVLRTARASSLRQGGGAGRAYTGGAAEGFLEQDQGVAAQTLGHRLTAVLETAPAPPRPTSKSA